MARAAVILVTGRGRVTLSGAADEVDHTWGPHLPIETVAENLSPDLRGLRYLGQHTIDVCR